MNDKEFKRYSIIFGSSMFVSGLGLGVAIATWMLR